MLLGKAGVCDCCDGMDEFDSPFHPTCEDTCKDHLSVKRQALLANYRKVKEGRLARAKVLDAHQRQLLRDEKTLDSLRKELDDLTKLRIAINRWLHKEQKAETWSRLAILRKFESECADGMYEACLILSDGINPDLEVFRYIIGGGYEDINHGSDEASQAATKAREADEKKKRRRDQTSSGGSSRSLVGRDRVMATECPKLSYEIITEARVARIHDTLVEYLTFTEGKAGSAARKLTVAQKRRSTTLFGAFLESQHGLALAVQIAAELLGLFIALPVSLPVYVAAKLSDGVYSYVTNTVQDCAITAQPGLKFLRVSEETGLLEVIEPNESSLIAENKDNWGYIDADVITERTWFEFLVAVVSGEHFTRAYRSAYKRIASAHAQVLRITCSIGIVGDHVAQFYEATLPGGQISAVMEQLDYTRYPLIMNTLQEVWEYTRSFRWVVSIAYRSPYIWSSFLLTSHGNSNLPVRRDACTLRAAKSVLEEEYDILSKRLDTEAKLVAEKRAQRTQGKSSVTGRKMPNSEEAMYGPSGDWEAVLSSDCMSTRMKGYQYELCFFGYVKQASKILGQFSGWSEELNGSNEGKLDESKIYRLLLQEGYREVPLHHRMLYTDGEFCHATGSGRTARITLVCGDTASILDVEEYEVNSWMLFMSMRAYNIVLCYIFRPARMI